MNSSRLALAGIHALLLFFAVLMLVPFAYMATMAFKSGVGSGNSVFLPLGDGFLGIDWNALTLENFRRLFTELSVARAFERRDWERLLARAGFAAEPTTVAACFPFRFAVGRIKPPQ